MYIADLHIHSRFSRATSRDLDAPHLDLWARRKGIQLIGTGDLTHPAWRAELSEHLVPAEEGLYRLRDGLAMPCETGAPDPRFVITGEISTIYKKDGRTRKVHSVILLPDLESAGELSRRLEAIGNIRSDGRPILGLDCRDLLEITLEACPEAIFIPAHIWTPHFSVLGAFSGFNTIEECFGDLSPHIRALETGLSSDPAMNRQVSSLDKYLLVSNSDAHSPAKLGREANMISGPLSWQGLARALNTGEGFDGTIEFFPEEGKYHLDGHRNCGLRLAPDETARLEGRCPVCGKKITVGVLNRVAALSDRAGAAHGPMHRPYERVVPLAEIIGACMGTSGESKKAQGMYFDLLTKLGPELDILRTADPEAIRRAAGEAVCEGICRLRAGKVRLEPGYDGEYGRISLFDPGELETMRGQIMMTGLPGAAPRKKTVRAAKPAEAAGPASTAADGPNEEQQAAIRTQAPAIAVIAGPGTGKTHTLTERIAYMIESGIAAPGEITALTFTNQAAAEMRARLEKRLGKKAAKALTVGTFHGVCLSLLPKKTLLGEGERLEIIRGLPGVAASRARETGEAISRYLNGAQAEKPAALDAYLRALDSMNARDLDTLLTDGLALSAEKHPALTHVLVDEYQDVNALQRRLALRFAQTGRSLFVIGDPDQSIYGFRGADAACFDDLKAALPHLETVTLRKNYRSTPEILAAARQVIANNPGNERPLCPVNGGGEPVRLVTADTPYQEGAFIAREIARMTGGMDMNSACGETARAFSDIAVMCRTRRQLEIIESCLRKADIPCLITGREDYLRADSVAGCLAFFAFLGDPCNIPALKTCLRLAFGCTPEEIETAEALLKADPSPENLALSAGFMGPLARWAFMWETLRTMPEKAKPLKRLETWEKHMGGDEAFDRLKSAALFFSDMDEMLQTLILGGEADLCRAAGKKYASGAVRLMTLHGAKGLEFPAVFLAGLTEGALPLARKGEDPDLPEERRLFYVGITRARQTLVITGSAPLSPFAPELPDAVRREQADTRRQLPRGEQLSFF